MKSGTKILLVTLPALVLPLAGNPLPPQTPTSGWEWPIQPRPADIHGSVLRPFDPPDRPWLSGHRGVDLKTESDAAALSSPAGGVVSFAGVVVDRPVVTIDHGGGLKSSFEPASSSLPSGATVSAGDIIGTVQAGHCAGVPCVHWGVRQNGNYINPLGFFLDLRPSILLPPTRKG